MKGTVRPLITLLTLLAVTALAGNGHAAPSVDTGTIRLGGTEQPATSSPDRIDLSGAATTLETDTKRGFDYDAFEARLLGLWFQRRAYLAQGREDDAARQSDAIRAFCSSEGIGRLPGIADALLLEARQFMDQGHYRRAADALDLAEQLDGGRSQVRFARASLAWRSGSGIFESGRNAAAGVRAAVVEGITDFSLFNAFGLIGIVASMGALVLFSLLMLGRYQVAFRHEIEEWCMVRGRAAWGRVAGWSVLLLPLVVWIGAGWAALYWIGALFRFMRRSERLAGVVLLVLAVAAAPSYRIVVGVFGLTSDPMIRTTLDASRGPYHPDRIVRVRELVDAHPDHATLRFLLAALYQDGKYLAEAFEEYRRALDLDPSLYQAHVNIGNLYHRTGQYNEAVANYLDALAIRPESVLGYYNMYIAQSESFRFKEANESLERARSLDPEELSALMARDRSDGDRADVVDAELEFGPVWSAAIEGGELRAELTSPEGSRPVLASLPSQLINPITIVAILALVAGGVIAGLGRPRLPARRCIRCGRPFCHRCKSDREGHEYCSQCLHLFVLGDGLAPETKNRKLYEVERYERRTRYGRRFAGLVFPGAGQVLRGRVLLGTVLSASWFAGLVAWQPRVLTPVETILGLPVRIDVLRGGSVPDVFVIDPMSLVGLALAVGMWIAANAPLLRRREA